MANVEVQPDAFLRPPVEDAFVFQIPLSVSAAPEVRYGTRRIRVMDVCAPGWSYLLDMSQAPSRRLDTTFDNAVLYLHQKTIDELCLARERPARSRLGQPQFGASDPVMYHLAHAWLPLLAQPAEPNRLLLDHLAAALFEHVMLAYGKAPLPDRRRGPSLMPWQMRRIEDFVDANLANNPSTEEISAECGLSASYFAEAFKKATGLPPHQWMLRRRIDHAKHMLRTSDATLTQVALACGFFDQSHFSRVFNRLENCAPAEWRRYYRIR